MKIGALEAGGTKMVLGIFSEEGELLVQETLPTEEPSVTMPQMQAFLPTISLAFFMSTFSNM